MINSEVNSIQISNSVLAQVAPSLQELGYRVEVGKTAADRIFVPVLFGRNGTVAKRFDADAYHQELRTVLEVEAGQRRGK